MKRAAIRHEVRKPEINGPKIRQERRHNKRSSSPKARSTPGGCCLSASPAAKVAPVNGDRDPVMPGGAWRCIETFYSDVSDSEKMQAEYQIEVRT